MGRTSKGFMASKLFRNEGIEARRDRLSGAVVAAVPPRAGLYAMVMGVGFVALLAFAVFGQFTSRTKVSGVVTYNRGFARIYPPQIATISAILVHEGDYVQAGQPLVALSLAQGRDLSGDGLAGQLGEISRQDSELARQQALARSQGGSDDSWLKAQRVSLASIIASLERQRGLAASQVALADAEAARAARLAAQGAASKHQADDAHAAAIARHTDAETLTERIASQQQALHVIEGQIAQRARGTRQTLSQLEGQRASLAGQRSGVLRADRLVLTAPIAGRVTDLVNEIGQRARPDAALVTVVPDGSSLEAHLYTPTRAAGFVHVGQEVRLMFDAFPFQKYGAGHGTVTDVSRVPADAGTIEPGLKIDEPVFRVRVRIDRVIASNALNQTSGNQALYLRPGMTLGANLVMQRRALWEVFFDPLLRAMHS